MANELRLVVVTPETTLLDESVESLRFPLYDGQIGILPGRAPMIGRLGYGELKVTGTSGELSYYVDGGFVQVQGSTVSILTSRSMPSDQINSDEAQEQLNAALSQVPTTDLEFAAKERDQDRARSMLALAK